MGVRVRCFAALREAAGTSETTAQPGPLAEVLAELRQRYGPAFAARLEAASVLVDGDVVDHGDRRWIDEGAEVALLPPFSGGAAGLR